MRLLPSLPLIRASESQNSDSNSAFDMFNTRQLGRRERQVLQIAWTEGSVTVQQVIRRLPIRLAYTTVMTTLDRLFKKGLLTRVKCDRAFLYSPALSPGDMENLRARALLNHLFYETVSSPDVLLSCLVEVIGTYDGKLLHDLEEKIKAARQCLAAPDSPAPQKGK